MTRQFLPPDIDDRYELGDVLGTGGSGAVYKAIERGSGSAVALKVLHQPLLTEPARVRFDREVAAHALLQNVAGVVQVHDHGIANERGWLAMDRHELTLAKQLATQGALSPPEAIPLLRDCATALAAVHHAGILHRDIKPSNVFITDQGRAVLADLGVAQIDGEPTLTGMTPLSLQWASPETIETGESSVATDLYSLGATAFAMLHGSPPFDLADGDSTVAVGPALRLIASGHRPELGAHLPAHLRDLVHDMMAVDPTQRPSSATRVLERLDAAPEHEGAEAPTPRPRSRVRRAMAAVVLVALVVAFGVAAAVWLTADGSSPAAAPTSEPTTAAPPPVPEPTPAPDPTSTAEATPAPEPTAAPEPAAVPAGRCEVASAQWCEPLVLANWDLTGDPNITTYTQQDTAFGPGFKLSPGPAANAGYAAEQSLPGVGLGDMVALRFRVLIEDLPEWLDTEEPWFQSIATVADERGSQWSVNLVADQDRVRFNAGFFAPEDFSGGGSAEVSHPVDQWHCVELLLDSTGALPVQMRVNDETLVEITDDEATNQGVGFLLSLGPRWLESPELAPTITLADAVVGESPLGC